MSSLKGKVAVVTGASKGIGASIAKHLASGGASVVVNYSSDKGGAEATVAAIVKAGGKAIAVGASVADAAGIAKIFAEAHKAFGPVDILVNNAGVYKFAPLEGVTEEDFDFMYNINVKGLLFATKAAAAQFPASGGVVINIGSVASDGGSPMTSVYSSTKGAVDTVTRVLAKELGPKGVRVIAVNPGPVVTEGSRELFSESTAFLDQMVATTPLGRVGQPDDIGKVVAFLASEDAGWVTGSLLQVAGGLR